MSEFLKQLTTLELILAPLCILLLILCFMQYCRLGKVMSGGREWRDAANRNSAHANALAEGCRNQSEANSRMTREIIRLKEEDAALKQYIWGSPPIAGRNAGDVMDYINTLRAELAQSKNKSAMLAEALAKYSEQLREIQKARAAKLEDVTA